MDDERSPVVRKNVEHATQIPLEADWRAALRGKEHARFAPAERPRNKAKAQMGTFQELADGGIGVPLSFP